MHGISNRVGGKYFYFTQASPAQQELNDPCIGVGMGGGGDTGGMCPLPTFQKLLYKLLITLCVVSNCAPPPIKKSFLCLCHWLETYEV